MECSACDLTPGQLQLSWHPDACQPGLTCLTGPERDPCVVRPQARVGVWQRRLVPGEGAPGLQRYRNGGRRPVGAASSVLYPAGQEAFPPSLLFPSPTLGSAGESGKRRYFGARE